MSADGFTSGLPHHAERRHQADEPREQRQQQGDLK
jgi:hypothetical protein